MDALYARQSIDKKDSISVETQLEMARSECRTEDYKTYEDRGYSGKNIKRPDFTRLMQDVEAGLVDRIIVYKIDRFSRSLLDFSNIWEILSKNHVEFISVNEKFDTSSPIGKAMLFIIMVFAQLERETTAERVTDNYYQRAKLGRWVGGPAPYGFNIGRLCMTAGIGNIPTLEENENMEVIKDIFNQYAEDVETSLGYIANYLNERLVPGVKRSTWNNVTIARILRNPLYVKADADIYSYYKMLGVKMENKITDFTGEYAGMLVGKRGASTRQRKEIKEATFSIANWEGHIESNIWLACQKKLVGNRQIGNSGKGKHSWLSGLLKCGYCNRSMRITVDSKYPDKRYMMCTGRIDHACNHVPKLQLYNIEAAVKLEIEKTLENCNNEPIEELQVISNQEKLELQGIEEQIANLIQCIKTGKAAEVTMQFINEELTRLTARQGEITEQIGIPKKQITQFEKIDFESLEMSNKKIVAKSYIQRVKIFEDDIEIVWNI